MVEFRVYTILKRQLCVVELLRLTQAILSNKGEEMLLINLTRISNTFYTKFPNKMSRHKTAKISLRILITVLIRTRFLRLSKNLRVNYLKRVSLRAISKRLLKCHCQVKNSNNLRLN